MGCDYSAKTLVGVRVTKPDFVVHEPVAEVVLCAHPEAVGNKFCPKCGKAERDRKVPATTRERLNPAVLACIEPDDGEEHSFEDLRRYEVNLGGFQLLSLATSSEDSRKPSLILGFEVARVTAEYDPPRETSLEGIKGRVDSLRELCARLDIADRPISLFTLCYASA